MASRLSSYTQPQPFRSSLVKNPPETVPPTDELEQLHSELKLAKQRAEDRRRKASDDLRTIEDSMRRMTEKEKGKFKAIDKVKRERDFTPLLDGDESKSTSSHLAGSTKSRNHSHPLNAVPSSSRSSVDPRRSAADEQRKKKKKRKREGGESDVEPEPQRPRKMSPPAAHAPTHVPPPKIPKPTISTTSSHTKSTSGPDFSLPAQHSQQLLPPRPPIPPPPIAGPSKPKDVVEDFSKAKSPAQVLITTFYSSVEPYIRGIKEEDVGFLEYTSDEVEPYVMPKLGRHYLEIWEDQDAGLLPPIILDNQLAPPTAFTAPTPKWDPSTLTEHDLVVEEKGHGPLTERVISALLPIPDVAVWKGVKAAEDAMEGRPGGSGAAAARRERLNVTDLEARIRDTMRYHGLLDSVPNFTERVDDPIASALREAQRDLRRIVATNKARKSRLVSIARDRLGYQEYLELRDSIDKNISTLYAKLQKKDVPKLSKKKKKPLQGAAAASAAANAAKGTHNHHNDESTPGPLAPCPAALGLTPDEDSRLLVNEQLKQLVETRRQWVDAVGSIFDMKETENPGRIYGLPKESIYQGIEEEIEAMLAAQPANEPLPNGTTMNGNRHPNGSSAGVNGLRNGVSGGHAPSRVSISMNTSGSFKGKERARSDAMDIG